MSEKVKISLEDLNCLAVTAKANGTQDAFIALILQWAAAAKAEIEQKRDYITEMESLFEELAKLTGAEPEAEKLLGKVQELVAVLGKVQELVGSPQQSTTKKGWRELLADDESVIVHRNLLGEVTIFPRR